MTTLNAQQHGPFETFAAADAAARPLYFVHSTPGSGVRPATDIARLSGELLAATLKAAGVELGAYDDEVAAVLGVLEPSIVVVLCGWITRANLEGSADGRAADRVDRLLAAARTVLVRCVDDQCQQTALRPVGTSYDCGQHTGGN